MHLSAMTRMNWFVKNYIKSSQKLKILDVGSYDVNGCFRSLFEGMDVDYIGLDLSEGPNVNYIPKDPYNWDELEDGSFDYIISGNAFEHIEYPWLTIREINKKLKTGGYAAILAPNTIPEHRYPIDCYRYFSDGFRALAKWGNLEVISVSVGGVPEGDYTEDEWSGPDDTFMILAKGISKKDILALPKLENEKRMRTAEEWSKRYLFLSRWIEEATYREKYLNKISMINPEVVYLYGYNPLSRAIFYEFKKGQCDRRIFIVDCRATEINNNIVIKLDEVVDTKDSLLLISVLDEGVIDGLRKIYRNLKMFYSDELILGV